MKKYMSAFCSLIASFFTFVIMSLDWLSIGSSFVNKSTFFTGYELLDVRGVSGSIMFKFCAIVSMIWAVFLFLSSILVILQNLNIIKSAFNFRKFNAVLLTIFALLVALLILAFFLIANNIVYDLSTLDNDYKSYILGGIYILIATGFLTCVFGWIFSGKQKNKLVTNNENTVSQNPVTTTSSYPVQNNTNIE